MPTVMLSNPHVSLDNVMFEVRPVHSPDDLLRTCSQLESLLQQQAQLQQPAARKVRGAYLGCVALHSGIILLCGAAALASSPILAVAIRSCT